MNGEGRRMMDMLIQDKGKKYKVIVDNDSVCIEDIAKEETIYEFEEYGYELIVEIFKHLGVNAEMC